jgi:hypothetical protein
MAAGRGPACSPTAPGPAGAHQFAGLVVLHVLQLFKQFTAKFVRKLPASFVCSPAQLNAFPAACLPGTRHTVAPGIDAQVGA